MLKEFSFNWSLVSIPYNWQAFKYVKIDLADDIFQNVANLSEFLADKGYEMINEKACQNLFPLIEKYFDEVYVIVGKINEAQINLEKWQAVLQQKGGAINYNNKKDEIILAYALAL